MTLCNGFKKVFPVFVLFVLVYCTTCKSLNSVASIYYGVTETKSKTTNQTSAVDVPRQEFLTDKPVVIVYKSSYEEDDDTEYNNPRDDEDPIPVNIKSILPEISSGNESLYKKTNPKVLESPVNFDGDLETANTVFLPFIIRPRPADARKGCRFRKRRGRKFGGGWQICDY